MEYCTKGGAQPKRQRDRETGEKTNLLTEGEEELGEVAGRSPEMEAAGERWTSAGAGKSPETEVETERGQEKNASGPARSGWRQFFKTRDGHTGQSTVPVRCTPDSAQ